MSGIAGILVRSGGRAVAESEIKRMLAAMPHRAKDGSSWWAEACVSFGHAWLNTTGEAIGGPLQIAGGKLVITCDARLDNREDLLARLGQRDRHLPDGDLIMRAYLRWGEACPEYLQGDFAFAIWDAERQLLFCARDHFGVKPLYYHSTGTSFLFASEIRPILAAGGQSQRINENQIADFLTGHVLDMQSTPYADIFRLPPRHSLSVVGNRVTLRNYWRLEPSRRSVRPDTAEEFRSLFAESVRNRMRGTTQIGAMLSGGLDSSSIACVASGLGDRDSLKTFSLIFPEGSSMDERRFIDSVLQQGGFDPHLISVVSHAPFADFERILEEQEGTFLALGIAMTRGLYRAAADGGTKVLLDGHGGDEVVSQGYGLLHELASDGQWIRLWRELGGASAVYGDGRLTSFLKYHAFYGSGSRIGNIRRLAGRVGNKVLSRKSAPAGVPPWRELVNPALVARTGLDDRLRALREVSRNAVGSEALMHRRDVSSGMVSHALETLDKEAANFGVEARYPFWDKPLVQFCLSLPAEEKLKDGWTRYVLRRAMQGILPPLVQWRRDKIDFTSSLVTGMLRNHRPLIARVLGADGDRIAPYVNLCAVTKAFKRLSENPTQPATDDVVSVWRSVSLSLWLRQVEERGAAA